MKQSIERSRIRQVDELASPNINSYLLVKRYWGQGYSLQQSQKRYFEKLFSYLELSLISLGCE